MLAADKAKRQFVKFLFNLYDGYFLFPSCSFLENSPNILFISFCINFELKSNAGKFGAFNGTYIPKNEELKPLNATAA